MSQVIAQRGLTTQSNGVEVGSEFGTFTRRPYGPSLAGWAKGRSAHNSNTVANTAMPLSGGSTTKLLFGAWFRFGIGDATNGNGIIEPLRLVTSDAAETQVFLLNVSTMALQVASYNGWFAATNCGTIPNHRWIFLSIISEIVAGANSLLKVLYREAGGSDQILASLTGINMNGRTWGAAHYGTRWQNGAIIPARIGLPSDYDIDSAAADAFYPPDIIEPPVATVQNVWYVSSGAVGGGDGTSLAQAWTPAEAIAETGPNNYTVTSGEVRDPTNGLAVVNTDALNADALYARYMAGTAIPWGDKIYFNDAAGPVRLTSQFAPTLSGGVNLLADPSLGRAVELRGTTRLSGAWTLISGANYKKAIACKYPVLFEFDSQAEADSRSGKARWLAHPAGITTAAGFAAASTDGSFGTDGGAGAGTEVYVRATGSGDPAANGKVYEVTTGGDGDFILLAMRHALMRGLITRYCAAVDTNNTTAPTARVPSICGDGMIVIDNNEIHAAGRHAVTIFEIGTSLKQRIIVTNNTMTDCRPKVYGDQTMTVVDGTTNGRDNQYYFRDNRSPTNSGVVGSTVGTVDLSQYTLYEHSSGGAHPYSKGWWINNAMNGTAIAGVTTSAVVITGNTLGYPGATDNWFGGTALTLTQNTISGIGLPAIGAAGESATIIGNDFVQAGAVTVTSTWAGTIEFDGNDIDATASTGGATKALATGGTIALGGNNILLPDADAIRLFDTPAALVSKYNAFQYTDPAKILVTNIGAATKTLAQLQAGGTDVGSVRADNLFLNSANRRIAPGSAARGLVPLASVPALAATADFEGRLRPSSGFTDAGSRMFRIVKKDGFHDRQRRRRALARRR